MFDAKKLLEQFLGSQVPAFREASVTEPGRPPISPRTIR